MMNEGNDPVPAVSTSLASAANPQRPRGMKGFVYDYIDDRIERLKNGENVEQILTSDVWYDLVDETRNSKWAGSLAVYFKQKYGFSIKSQKAADRRTRETIIAYIKDVCDERNIRRIDINIYAGDVGYFFFRGHAVKNKVGPQRLWNWILDKLDETFPDRNYNRAVRTPEPHWFRPQPLDQLNDLVDKRLTRVLGHEIVRCEEELSDYQGFIYSVSAYEKKLYWRFDHILNGNSSTGASSGWLRNITNDIAGLVSKYGGGKVSKEV
jgi:hypothetical protein